MESRLPSAAQHPVCTNNLLQQLEVFFYLGYWAVYIHSSSWLVLLQFSSSLSTQMILKCHINFIALAEEQRCYPALAVCNLAAFPLVLNMSSCHHGIGTRLLNHDTGQVVAVL